MSCPISEYDTVRRWCCHICHNLFKIGWMKDQRRYLKRKKIRLRGLCQTSSESVSDPGNPVGDDSCGYDRATCDDRGQSKTRHRGQNIWWSSWRQLMPKKQRWRSFMLTDRLVRFHHSFPWTINEIFDIVFQVHKTGWPLPRKSKNHWICRTILRGIHVPMVLWSHTRLQIRIKLLIVFTG